MPEAQSCDCFRERFFECGFFTTTCSGARKIKTFCKFCAFGRWSVVTNLRNIIIIQIIIIQATFRTSLPYPQFIVNKYISLLPLKSIYFLASVSQIKAIMKYDIIRVKTKGL